VLGVNPTHIACALAYDPSLHAAPVLLGKGEGPVAATMRQAAEAEGVPIIRNVELARALRDKAVIDDIVPQDLFAAVAEVILWARRIRETATEEAASDGEDDASAGPRFPALPEIALQPHPPSPEEPR
jgi:type III secretion protein U